MPKGCLTLRCRYANKLAQLRLAERGMCAQRYHKIEAFRIVQTLHQKPEQRWQRNGARVIGDQDQHALACEPALQPLAQCLADDIVTEQAAWVGNSLSIHRSQTPR